MFIIRDKKTYIFFYSDDVFCCCLLYLCWSFSLSFSKFRPKSEQHIDNFSLSTVAEGSQANVRKLCDTPTNLPHARALAYYDNIMCQVTFLSFLPLCFPVHVYWRYKVLTLSFDLGGMLIVLFLSSCWNFLFSTLISLSLR